MGHLRRLQQEYPSEDLHAAVLCLLKEPLELLHVEYGLGLEEPGARAYLLLELYALGLPGVCLRRDNRADIEIGLAPKLRVLHVPAVVQSVYDAHELYRIDVEYGLGLPVVAEGQVVAGEGKDVPYAQNPRAHYVGLEREPVPVPARHLEHGVDALFQQEHRAGQRREAHHGPLVVGDVRRGNLALQEPRLLHERGNVSAPWRSYLGGDDEPARFQLFFKKHALFFLFHGYERRYLLMPPIIDSNTPLPSREPSSPSHALSGWGIMPSTFPFSLTIPAISESAPLGLASSLTTPWGVEYLNATLPSPSSLFMVSDSA